MTGGADEAEVAATEAEVAATEAEDAAAEAEEEVAVLITRVEHARCRTQQEAEE